MKTTPRTEAEAVKASRRTLLPVGMADGEIREASDQPSKRGKEMITLIVVVRDADGIERELRDFLTDAPVCAVRLRHVSEAVAALDKYENGSIGAEDFPGHAVRVKIGIEKKKGFPDRNVIADYAPPAAARVVNLTRAG